MEVYKQWEQTTGTPWSEAKKRGLTNGSYESNIALSKRLQSGEFSKQRIKVSSQSVVPRTKPILKVQPQKNVKDPVVKTATPPINKASRLDGLVNSASFLLSTAYNSVKSALTPDVAVPSKVNVVTNPKKTLAPTISPYAKLPSDARSIIESKSKNPKFESYEGKYYVLSKENGTMYVVNNKHQVIDQALVGRGAAVGDYPNRSDPNSNKPGPNATTPGGSAVIRSTTYDPAYKGVVARINYNDASKMQGNGVIAIHPVYPPEFLKRNAILNDKSQVDKLMSWGCINVPEDKLKAKTFAAAAGDSLFISNEPERNRLKVQANMNLIRKK